MSKNTSDDARAIGHALVMVGSAGCLRPLQTILNALPTQMDGATGLAAISE